MILTQAQAQAVYSAMCALNNVGVATLQTTILSKEVRIELQTGIGVHIKAVARTTVPATQTKEDYANQAEFARTYGLN